MFFEQLPGWRIGRRAGLKNQWGNSRAGSIPAPGTFLQANTLYFQ